MNASVGWSCSSQEKNSLDAIKDAIMYDRDKPITIDKQRSCSLQIYLPTWGWQDNGMVPRQHRNKYPGARLNI